MVFMMEPDTASEQPESIALRDSARWSESTLNFLKLTEKSDLQVLRRDGFIQAALDSACERKSDLPYITRPAQT